MAHDLCLYEKDCAGPTEVEGVEDAGGAALRMLAALPEDSRLPAREILPAREHFVPPPASSTDTPPPAAAHP